MIKSFSIRYKIILGFAVVLFTMALPGLFSLSRLSEVSQVADEVLSIQFPFQTNSLNALEQLTSLNAQGRAYMASRENLGAFEDTLLLNIQKMKAHLLAARFGSESEQFKEVFAQLKEQGIGLEIGNIQASKNVEIQDQLTSILEVNLPEYETKMHELFAAHQLKASYQFSHKGKKYDLETFVADQYISFRHWMGSLERSSKSGFPFEGNLNPEKDPFLQWVRQKIINDSAFLSQFKLISMYSKMVFKSAEKVAKAEESERLKLFEFQSKNVFKRYDAMLSNLKPLAATALRNAVTSEAIAIDGLEKATSEIKAKMEKLNKQIGVEVSIAKQHASTITNEARDLVLIVLTVGSVTGLVLGHFIGSGIAAPIKNIEKVMCSLSKGDLEVKVPAQDRKDEVGAMANAVRIFREGLREAEVASRELLQERQAAKKKALALEDILNRFSSNADTFVEKVAIAAQDLREISLDMSQSIEMTLDRTDQTEKTVEDVDGSIQSVASSTEELNASVKEISHQIGRSVDISQMAAQEATITNQSLRDLLEVVEKIGNIVGMINTISEQTNLLALNATIEANRAGESGKGFAVVASEVKTLANQTGQAIDEVSNHISLVQNAAKSLNTAISMVTQRISEIDESSSAISVVVEEQSNATNEIAKNIEDVANESKGVRKNINEASNSAVQTNIAANEVKKATIELQSQSQALKVFVNDFLDEVRMV
jgi:methyl-accepting chemotaxis protein